MYSLLIRLPHIPIQRLINRRKMNENGVFVNYKYWVRENHKLSDNESWLNQWRVRVLSARYSVDFDHRPSQDEARKALKMTKRQFDEYASKNHK